MEVTDEQFHGLINEAMATLPKIHVEKLQNVAILLEDVPSTQQRIKLGLKPTETLLGLYEGIPLSQRQGQSSVLPDKITLYKLPILATVSTMNELKEQIRHTLWHEIAHYYGLDHPAISALE